MMYNFEISQKADEASWFKVSFEFNNRKFLFSLIFGNILMDHF